ncbi:MAG: EAL domain-containing protein [Azonexaceae bacterium]|nr:EAL domain-containing protein [Azonexaceae bacterium]
MSANLRRNLLLCLAYAVSGWLSLKVAVPPGYAAPLFPPAGIALAAMLIYGPRCLPGVFLGSFAVQFVAAWQTGLSSSDWLALGLPAIGASLQATVGYWLAGRLNGPDSALDTPESILRFVGIVAPLGCLISPSIGVGMLVVLGAVPSADAMFTWMNWWAGDTLGVLIMLPLVMVFLARPAAAWRSRRLAVTVPMSVALGLLAFTFVQVRDWEERRLQTQFNRDAEHLASLVKRRLDAQLDQVLALEGLAAVHPALDANVWREFVMPLLARYPGTQNFGWSPLIEDAGRDAFEAAIRRERPDFAILGRDPAGHTYIAQRKAEYLPILFVEPLVSNRSVVGLDPLVLERTAVAAKRTRDSRMPIASESIRLVQERGEQRGVVVYEAVFGGQPERQLGMVSAVFRMDDAMIAALEGSGREQVEVCLVEGTPGEGPRLFGPAGCESLDWAEGRLRWQTPLSFAGRQWYLRAGASPAYMESLRSWGVWLTLALGLLTTGVLGAFLLLTSGRARRVEMLVDERTHQLAEASRQLAVRQEELLQAQRIARMGSWEQLPRSELLYCSGELCSVLQLPPRETIGQAELLACIHPEDRAALAHALARVAETPGEEALDCRLGEEGGLARVLHFRIESGWLDKQGLRVRGTAQDVTAARAAEAHIAYLAHYDVLTGLPNRTLWNERAQNELRSAERHGDTLAVLFLDLDHFKAINDTLGHPVGDQLLSAVARRLSACLRENDFLARLGGDEFVVLLPRLSHPEDAALVARKLIASLQSSIDVGGHELSISVSIGISLFPGDGEDLSTLLKHADVAMYSAKGQGRNTYHYFKPEMDVHALERLMLENALRRAVDRNELVLFFQPQMAAGGGLSGCEALIRWQHPEFGLLPPAQFIGVAEDSGLILPLGEWVLAEACRQWVEWHHLGIELTMAVNISALQFQHPEFVAMVRRILGETGADPAWLELELTESALMQPTPEVLARMNELRKLGIQLALDDFGTGYSSLSYLKRLPIHRLKLDRSFVRDLPDDAEDVAIASATLSLARDLGMEVVAEGVENDAQHRFLLERGCAVMQGYLFGKPMPAEAFVAWRQDLQNR